MSRLVKPNEACDRIIQFAKEKNLTLNTPADLEQVIAAMCQNGFRMHQVLQQLKPIWIEIRMLQGVKVNLF